MPLDRANVTATSRIMLPAYVILTATVGFVYTFDPFGRVAAVSALTFQRSLMPLWIWGALFLALAAVMLAAFARRSRHMFALALSVASVTWFTWGCFYLTSAVIDPHVSILAAVFPWFIATACIASMVSLVTGEGRP